MCPECFPASLTPDAPTPPRPGTHAGTVKMETTPGEPRSQQCVCLRVYKAETERRRKCVFPCTGSLNMNEGPITWLLKTVKFSVSVPLSTRQALPSSSPAAMTTKLPTTESLFPTVDNTTPEWNPTTPTWLRTGNLNSNECYRYAYGTFSANITIVGRWRTWFSKRCQLLCVSQRVLWQRQSQNILR